MDPVIGNANPLVAAALVKCARDAEAEGMGTDAVTVDGYPLLIGIKKGTIDDFHRTGLAVLHRVILRVDEAKARVKHMPIGQAIDRLLMAQEQALNALLLDWMGRAAPFQGHALHLERVTPEDKWAVHIKTIGEQHRASFWLITKRW